MIGAFSASSRQNLGVKIPPSNWDHRDKRSSPLFTIPEPAEPETSPKIRRRHHDGQLMKVTNRLDGSICGAFLGRRPPATWHSTRLPGDSRADRSRRLGRQEAVRGLHTSRWPKNATRYRSAVCPTSGIPIPSLTRIARQLLAGSTAGPARQGNIRSTHSSTNRSSPGRPWGQGWGSKGDLLSYVDQPEEESTVEEHLELLRDPYLRRYAPADGPELRVSDRREDLDFPSTEDTRGHDERTERVLWQLRRAIQMRMSNPWLTDTDEIWDRYHELPEPRMARVPGILRRQLMWSMGVVRNKDSKSMLRYFALVSEIKESGLALSTAEWNGALSFASRYVVRSGHPEVEAALQLWREMELDAGTRGNALTFNILFDVASKAGNFTLAEMIYKEMQKRGFAFNRFHHVSLIHFFGLRQDADGLRAAYKEMVNAGEMIDTVVLNCVLAGLLRCGEEDSAHQLYERMKANHGKSPPWPTRSYASDKVIQKALRMFATISKRHPERQADLQNSTPMTPDFVTYRLLIHHFASRVGDIGVAAKYLDDMRCFDIPLHKSIFTALFKGFANHGGYAGSPWSEQRLLSVWKALLAAIDSRAPGLQLGTWFIMYVLLAFERCSSPQMLFKAYQELSLRWELSEGKIEWLIDRLHTMLKKKQGPKSLLHTLSTWSPASTGHTMAQRLGSGPEQSIAGTQGEHGQEKPDDT